jgi:D-glycero-D-manno-heptose 1,7-bisphosphate phosphatase
MRYIIFDRDGTLIEHKQYLHKPQDVKLTPGSREIVLSFLEEGYLLFLHTNQSGVGRGYFKMEDVKKCNEKMIELLNINSKIFEDICIASDYPPIENTYRKPSIRFGSELIKKYEIKSTQLIYIGDNTSDLETAYRLNCMGYGISFNSENSLLDIDKITKKFNFSVYKSLSEIKNDIIKNDI